MMPTLKIKSEDQGQRLDVLLARAYPDYSRSFLQKWVKSGRVRLGSQVPTPNYRVRAGEVIEVDAFEAGASDVAPADPKRDSGSEDSRGDHRAAAPVILHEDSAILVIDKPAGVVVHPAPSHHGPTLIDWLRDHLGGKVVKVFTDPERLGLVHRLDKDTSGVLLIAKSIPAQIALAKQFHDRTVRKSYIAFVEGIPSALKGIISAPVGRSLKQPSRMAISTSGRPSETEFEVADTYPAATSPAGSPRHGRAPEVSQLNLFPKTGRTHQLRVHLAAIGHPIVGDRTYGSKEIWSDEFGIQRCLLHAQRLEIQHPTSKKKVSFEAPWPTDFKEARKKFRAAFLTISVLCLTAGASLQAADGTAKPAVKKPATSSSAASGTSATSASTVRALKKDVSALKDQIDEVKQMLDVMNSSLSDLNLARRLHDLEKSIVELNSKAVAGNTSVDESKTQLMELQRKLKQNQDILDSLRDQVDRLQREVIQRRVQQENEPVNEPPVDRSQR